MTTLDLDSNTSKYVIRAYKSGSIKINDKEYRQSIIVTPDRLIEDWPPQSIDSLERGHLDVLLTIKPDILLIGCGETHQFIPLEFYGELINQGIGVEIMSSSAASRTFNALSSENRNVAAALIIR